MFGILIIFIQISFSEPTDKMADKVIQLRQEVETLNEMYETEKEKVYSQLRVIGTRKSELESNIQSDKLRNKQIHTKIYEMKSSINKSSVESETLKPLLEKQIQKLKLYIESSLPFRSSERLKAVSQLEEKVLKGDVDLMKATTQLWQLVEDEKRLGKENVLGQQTVRLNGTVHLAEVVRLGMMNLYFKTDSGVFGHGKKTNGTWGYSAYTGRSEKKNVKNLFLSMKKQIRTGYFEVPGAML